MNNMNFSQALELIKKGASVTRGGWNGAKSGLSMYVFAQVPDQNSKMTNPYLVMSVEKSNTPWQPSQLDLFADDWQEVQLDADGRVITSGEANNI